MGWYPQNSELSSLHMTWITAHQLVYDPSIQSSQSPNNCGANMWRKKQIFSTSKPVVDLQLTVLPPQLVQHCPFSCTFIALFVRCEWNRDDICDDSGVWLVFSSFWPHGYDCRKCSLARDALMKLMGTDGNDSSTTTTAAPVECEDLWRTTFSPLFLNLSKALNQLIGTFWGYFAVFFYQFWSIHPDLRKGVWRLCDESAMKCVSLVISGCDFTIYGRHKCLSWILRTNRHYTDSFSSVVIWFLRDNVLASIDVCIFEL